MNIGVSAWVEVNPIVENQQKSQVTTHRQQHIVSGTARST